ncbi:SAM-dependent DNA methyltransferase [Candidatus Puniceispirillum sp.]|nr:SAM-dependent DNA methyltransferase [Candidatus Puniceispirillum sp.]
MIKSKERKADFGEVFTSEREVKAMLDLVEGETCRIESRFLEPACGDGNFLIEVLRRKLEVVKKRYCDSNLEFQVASFQVIASLYGVDILLDNVETCRERLLNFYENFYESTLKQPICEKLKISLAYVLGKNIIQGDAISLRTSDGTQPIVFCEWSFVSGTKVKRVDYTFENLIAYQPFDEQSLFSDLGTEAFLPPPIKTFGLVNFLKVSDE